MIVTREQHCFLHRMIRATQSRFHGIPICIVGGYDLALRIPFLKRLEEAGFEPIAIGSGPEAPFRGHGIRFVNYPMYRGINPWLDLGTLNQLTSILAREKPTIVHAFDTKPSIYAIWAARTAGVPIRIRTITGLGEVYSKRSPFWMALGVVLTLMHRYASRQSQFNAFYNHYDYEFAITHWSVKPERAAVVPGSGIDVEQFQAQIPCREKLETLRRQLAPDGGPIIVMISRILREKGVLEYLAAARKVRAALPRAHFYLVGHIEPAGSRTITIQQLGRASPDVTWLGPREDVPALLSVADLLVLPTFYGEGIPRVLLEAGLARTAVVASEVAGCTEVIRHTENGWLVPPRNSEMLADAISFLLGHPELRNQLAQQLAAEIDAKFSLARIVDIWLSIYEKLLSEIPAGPTPGFGQLTANSICK
jgi:glycosyltransferase involved in cell wall biosynthesis